MRRAILLIVSLLLPAILMAREPGTARGTITFNGKAKTLTYAYAWKQPSNFDKSRTNTVVVLSDTRLDDATLADHFALVDLARKGRFTGVQLYITPLENVETGTFYTAAEDGYFDASGMHKWTKKILSPSLIEGKLATEAGEHHFFKTSFSYSADFKAPIGPAPKK